MFVKCKVKFCWRFFPRKHTQPGYVIKLAWGRKKWNEKKVEIDEDGIEFTFHQTLERAFRPDALLSKPQMRAYTHAKLGTSFPLRSAKLAKWYKASKLYTSPTSRKKIHLTSITAEIYPKNKYKFRWNYKKTLLCYNIDDMYVQC